MEQLYCRRTAHICHKRNETATQNTVCSGIMRHVCTKQGVTKPLVTGPPGRGRARGKVEGREGGGEGGRRGERVRGDMQQHSLGKAHAASEKAVASGA